MKATPFFAGFICFFSLIAAAADTPAPVASPGPAGPFAPTMQSFSNYRCPEWFQDAKFGIWSHWGPDSIPGISNNYAHDMYTQGSSDYKWQLEHYGHPSKVGYKDVIESWKAEKFDPDALVAKYKAAGAKYVVALATHHDNFDNFDSTFHEWNSVKHGPHKGHRGPLARRNAQGRAAFWRFLARGRTRLELHVRRPALGHHRAAGRCPL